MRSTRLVDDPFSGKQRHLQCAGTCGYTMFTLFGIEPPLDKNERTAVPIPNHFQANAGCSANGAGYLEEMREDRFHNE